MSTTLTEIAKAMESFQTFKAVKHKKSIVDGLLGKYKGIIPEGKTSTQYIKELRNTLYGKIE